MLFHSLEFFAFFPIAFALYWLTQRWLRLQNSVVLVASYTFYGWWDWRFLALVAASSVFDYAAGLCIENSESETRKRRILWASLTINLTLLGFFKYFNFFAAELQTLVSGFGVTLDGLTLNIVLPVGISFYTFQTLSYTLDIYAGRIRATRDPIAFFAFVSFFPQLVAGPIERAGNLLPQFLKPRGFNYAKAVSGSRLILWGFFKKVFVADSCAVVVNQIFDTYETQSGWSLAAGAALFAFQIYGDFSGYSDIARGLSRLLGFELMKNFDLPYFSRSITEFWRRWHISLSTWFRDYVFIPLGGSRGSTALTVRNLFVVFTVSGLWHGANWTFVVWGALNAALMLPTLLFVGRSRTSEPAEGQLIPGIRESIQIAMTFVLICITWIIFRSETLADAWAYMSRMTIDCLQHPGGILVAFRKYRLEPAVLLVLALVTAEWLSRWRAFSFQHFPAYVRWGLYQTVFTVVIWLAFYRKPSEFIYFQF